METIIDLELEFYRKLEKTRQQTISNKFNKNKTNAKKQLLKTLEKYLKELNN